MKKTWLIKFPLFFIISGFLALHSFGNRADTLTDQIDGYFAEYNQPDKPGASVAVVKNGAILYAKGYGLQRLLPSEKTTERTNYRLASVSKQFSAMAILILVDQGKLTLETTLTQIFPSFPAYGAHVTIRHLLNHTSGLKDYENMVSGPEQILDSGVLALMKKQSSTDFSPGTQYRYSNGGYCILSQIVETVAGMPFGLFTKRYIFDPIGMKDTQFFVKGESLIQNRAYGYTSSGNSFTETDQSSTSATMGDGGVYTSATEWVYWENALQNATLISPTLQKAMFTSGVLNNGAKTGYGFGMALDTYMGIERQSHTGSTIGFRTAMQRFPAKSLSILVMINRANTSTSNAPWNVAQRIADLYL